MLNGLFCSGYVVTNELKVHVLTCVCWQTFKKCLIFFLRFFYESERGLFPNTEFVFDLELPLDFIPKNNDGEVETFELLPAKVC